MFCYSWTTYLEPLTCQSARHGSQLHRIQKTTKNITYVSDGLRRIVTFLIILRLINTLTYLLMSLPKFVFYRFMVLENRKCACSSSLAGFNFLSPAMTSKSKAQRCRSMYEN